MKSFICLFLVILAVPSGTLRTSPSIEKEARKEAKTLCYCHEHESRSWTKDNEKSVKRGETYIDSEGRTMLGIPWTTNNKDLNNCLRRKRRKNMREFIDSLSDHEVNMFIRFLKRELKIHCSPELNLTVDNYKKNAFEK